jgi:hypothetical protein
LRLWLRARLSRSLVILATAGPLVQQELTAFQLRALLLLELLLLAPAALQPPLVPALLLLLGLELPAPLLAVPLLARLLLLGQLVLPVPRLLRLLLQLQLVERQLERRLLRAGRRQQLAEAPQLRGPSVQQVRWRIDEPEHRIDEASGAMQPMPRQPSLDQLGFHCTACVQRKRFIGVSALSSFVISTILYCSCGMLTPVTPRHKARDEDVVVTAAEITTRRGFWEQPDAR